MIETYNRSGRHAIAAIQLSINLSNYSTTSYNATAIVSSMQLQYVHLNVSFSEDDKTSQDDWKQ